MFYLKSSLVNVTKPRNFAFLVNKILNRNFKVRRGPRGQKMKSPEPNKSGTTWPTLTYFAIIVVFSSMVAINARHGSQHSGKNK